MITEIFYHTDNFCKEHNDEIEKQYLEEYGKKKIVNNEDKELSISEIMTIIIYYHYSGYHTFKDYYLKYIKINAENNFSDNKIVSYNRFLELKRKVLFALALFAKYKNSNRCTGISFIDSFSLPVCHIKRCNSNKTFKGMTKKGKTSMGWFFGFKTHIIINPYGEIIDFCITKGNVSDNNTNVLESLTTNVYGKVFGDKGYLLRKGFFEKLFNRGVKIVTKIRKNMKNILMDLDEKMILTKRGLVESAINILKRILLIDNTRHRSPINFFVSIFSGLIAYSFRENKPSLDVRSDLLIC